ncbi:MAG: hypothetical protein P4L50_09975 [Anaerolineaceae bacterium]|nr:hypothetical protein [Anaerolineaceae bacterium]
MEVAESNFSEPEEEKKKSSPPAHRFDGFWNFLTLLVILAMIAAAGFFGFIYMHPSSRMNPYPPAALPATLVLPSPTNTPLPPTATDTATPFGYKPPTATPTVTIPVTPSDTPIPLTPTNTLPGPLATSTVNPQFTATPTDDANAYYTFAVQSPPEAVAATLFSTERGCQWMGVAGRVLDMQGRPVTGLIVQLSGVLGQSLINETSLTGLALQFGQSGYEFKLADTPIQSQGTLWVRLVDQANLPLSPKIHFDTYTDCSKNQILINFKQVH